MHKALWILAIGIGTLLPAATEAQTPPAALEREARRVVESWRTAWEAGDIGAYMRHYADDFRSRGMDRDAWWRYKAAVFQRSGEISVDLWDVEVDREGSRIQVRFDQRYRSDIHQDYGSKVLTLAPRADGLRIVREEWEPYPPEVEPPAAEEPAVIFDPVVADTLDEGREGMVGEPEPSEEAPSAIASAELPPFEPMVEEDAGEVWMQQPSPSGQSIGSSRRVPSEAPDRLMVVEEIVAKVNDAIITRSELEAREAEQSIELYRQYEGAELRERLASLRQSVLEELINELLLLERANDLGVDIESFVQRWIEDTKADAGVESDEELENLLEAEGMTLAEYKERIKRRKVPQRLVYEEVTQRIQISEEELRAYYDEHQSDFLSSESVRLREIVLLQDEGEDPDAVRRAAREVYRRLTEGADFAETARRVSDTPSAASGGRLGRFTRDEMSPELAEVAFSLEEGEISEPVRTAHGWHILELEEKSPAAVEPFEEVQDEIYDRLAQSRWDERLEEYLEDLYRTNTIVVNENYQPGGWGDQPLSRTSSAAAAGGAVHGGRTVD